MAMESSTMIYSKQPRLKDNEEIAAAEATSKNIRRMQYVKCERRNQERLSTSNK